MFFFLHIYFFLSFFFFFFFNDTATTEIYTLPLHDALPISLRTVLSEPSSNVTFAVVIMPTATTTVCSTVLNPFAATRDRKSTRLNSSHGYISYAVFCLKKKKN